MCETFVRRSVRPFPLASIVVEHSGSRSRSVWTDAYAKTYIRFTLGFVPDIDLEEHMPFVSGRSARSNIAVA